MDAKCVFRVSPLACNFSLQRPADLSLYICVCVNVRALARVPPAGSYDMRPPQRNGKRWGTFFVVIPLFVFFIISVDLYNRGRILDNAISSTIERDTRDRFLNVILMATERRPQYFELILQDVMDLEVQKQVYVMLDGNCSNLPDMRGARCMHVSARVWR